jgi:NAD(P)-dependent dehydrogenase (short-subunit alcohol dehydrogenase family)
VSAGRFEGKVAVITGSTTGIGAASAERFTQEGGQVVLTGRSEKLGRELEAALNGQATFISGDLTSPGVAERIVESAISTYGRIDVLVNNAGIDLVGDLVSTSLETVREVFNINFFAALNMLQIVVPHMRSRGGAVVNVTSRLATVGVPLMALYGSSKGALLTLTRAAAVELAPQRVRVNAVAPGMTNTPMYSAWLADQLDQDKAHRQVVEHIPQGRLAEVSDVAAAIAYLASDDAAHITGVSLAVDGGYTAQ